MVSRSRCHAGGPRTRPRLLQVQAEARGGRGGHGCGGDALSGAADGGSTLISLSTALKVCSLYDSDKNTGGRKAGGRTSSRNIKMT